MAQAVLHGTDWESYTESDPFECPELTLDDGGKGRGVGRAFTQEELSRAMGLNVTVKPNLAATWTAVDFTLPGDATKATISITNALGVTVMSTELDGNTGQKVLDLRGLAAGVYVYTVRCGDCIITDKLMIKK